VEFLNSVVAKVGSATQT